MDTPAGNKKFALSRRQAAAILAVLLVGLVGLYGLRRDWGSAYGKIPKEGLIVQIPRGSSHRQIAELLAAKGLVRSSLSFRLLAARNFRRTLHAGEYMFEERLSPKQIIRMLIMGRVYLHTVTVPEGYTIFEIADLLVAKGLVRSSLSFRLLAARNFRRTLHAGEYMFDQRLSPKQIIRMLITGHVYLHTVTVPEGYTIFEIADLLEKEGLATRKDFLEMASDPTLVRYLAPGAPNLEGFLFPETYKFP